MAHNTRITFEWNGSEYVLEFDRDSAVKAEEGYGISMRELSAGKASTAYDLFACAFIKHHPRIKGSTVKAIYDQMTDKVGLNEQLMQMYAEAAGSLLDDPDDEGKAISWKAK